MLQGFLEDALADTQDWLSAVEDAGVPDVEGGEEYANQVQNAAQEANDVLEETATSVDELPTDDPQAFAREAGTVGDSAREALGKVGDAITEPESDELKTAFEDAQECKEIASAG